MLPQGKAVAGQACLVVSATHVLVDIGRTLPPISPNLDALHGLEPTLLCAATAALLLHLLLERAFFDRMMAAAHGCNLIVGWLGASADWLSVTRVLCELDWFRVIAPLALLIAATATVIEILGLRHRRRRASLVAAVVLLALCMQPRDGRESASMLPHYRFDRRELLIGLA